MANAKGDQRGMEQHAGVWSLAVSAVVWSLSCTQKVVHSTLLGLLINVLVPMMPSVGFPQEPICGWSRSADMAVLTTCADILGVSPCQMGLL